MKINIKVHARSKRESVVELPDGSYKVEVKAPPVDGAANEALNQIDQRGYLLPYERDERRLHKVGIAFSTEERTLKEWRSEEVKSEEVNSERVNSE